MQKKWKNLKDCYRKSQAKKRGKSGDSADCIPKKWKYEDEMSFLLPNLKERPQKSNLGVPTDDAVNEDIENSEDDGGESSVATPETFDDTAVLSPRSEILGTPSSSASTVSKRKRLPKPEVTTAAVLQNFLDNKEKRKKADHLTKFFEFAEETTRTLPPELQVELKHRISMLLYEFESKAIKNSSLNTESTSSSYSLTINNDKVYTNL